MEEMLIDPNEIKAIYQIRFELTMCLVLKDIS